MKTTKFFVGFFAGMAMLSFGIGWWHKTKSVNAAWLLEKARQEQENKQAADFYEKLSAASDIKDLELIDDDYEKLPPDWKKEFKPIVDLKRATYTFEEAESELARVIQLVDITKDKKAHPLAEKTFLNSLRLYKEAKAGVDRLNEIKNNDEYNFCLYYLKGEIYYRTLELVAAPEEVPSIFNQTVDAYKRALLIKNRDINTEINVEILIKRKSELLSRGNEPGSQKIQRLIQQGVGSGRKKGNF